MTTTHYMARCSDGVIRAVYLTARGERILVDGTYRRRGWRGITW
jgi:hypothetical protein